ncbi:purine-cytosine permease family protein [Streptomyces sp. NPDC007088]|uniref:purine-cytosine permease family protein n=1 Tax=Streptomyces sp. NPDC007088 TaxID=3364773 RepID=UPI0036B00FA6
MAASADGPAKEQARSEEYEDTPVPAVARRGLLSVSAVWFGFPMNLGNAVFGGVIVYNLGLPRGLGAILVGNLVLLAYVGVLSHAAARTGENFSLQAAGAFGARGRVPAAAFLSTVVIGWFSFQIGLTGTTLQQTLGWSPWVGALVGGVLYTAVTVVGIRALSLLGLVAAPLFVVLAVVALGFGLRDGDTSVGSALAYSGGGHALSFGAAVSIVVAGFADSGTMTADFTRWAKDGRSAVFATVCAFPFANGIAFGVGGLVVAVGGAVNPAVDGGGFLGLLTGHGPLLTGVAVLFVLANLGSVATHCLYNAAVGWSSLTRVRMRPLAVVLGLLGLLAALTGVWDAFLDWLNLLGVFVPPIGAVLVVDQIRRRRSARAVPTGFRTSAFVAWAAGATAAGLAHYLLPGAVDAVVGIIVAAAVLVTVDRRPAPVREAGVARASAGAPLA